MSLRRAPALNCAWPAGLLAAALLAGCAALGSGEPVPAPATAPPADYKKIVNGSVLPLFNNSTLIKDNPTLIKDAQISPLHDTVPPQRGDWLACLKLGGGGVPVYYAVFLQNRALLDLRRAVSVDHCETDSYEPLSPPKPPAPPPPAKKKPSAKKP